jgi:hypothetical protein
MSGFVETFREEWPKLALEFVVLVVGVTLSFAVDQWRRDREDRAYERRALGLIREGLVDDSVRASRMVGSIRAFRRAHEALLSPNPRPDSIDLWMDQQESYAMMVRSDWAYQELRLGGNTRVLRDNRVFAAVTQAYGGEYRILEEWDEVNRRMVLDRIIPYIDENSPFTPVTTDGGAVVGLAKAYETLRTQDRFRNLQRTALGYREIQIGAAERVIARIRRLLPMIDSALVRP